jgi:hypothetical protein
MTCAIADLGLAVRNIQGSLDIPENEERGGTVVCLKRLFMEFLISIDF